MEELLPLLIGVIWLAYTWYSKGQKKKQEKSRAERGEEETARKEPSVLEQILMGQEIRLDEPEEEYEYLEEEEDLPERKYEEPKPVSTPFLKTEIADYKGEGISSFTDRSRGLRTFMSEAAFEEEVYGNEFNTGDFDLRKAVILSEILNPPYIDYK